MTNIILPENFGNANSKTLDKLIRDLYRNGSLEEKEVEVDTIKQTSKPLAVGIDATAQVLKLENPKIRYYTREKIWNVENHLNIQGTAYIMSRQELLRKICTEGYEEKDARLLPVMIAKMIDSANKKHLISCKNSEGEVEYDLGYEGKKFIINTKKVEQFINYWDICTDSGNELAIVSDLETFKPITKFELNAIEYNSMPLKVLPRNLEIIIPNIEINANGSQPLKLLDSGKVRLYGGENLVDLEKVILSIKSIEGRIKYKKNWEAARDYSAGWDNLKGFMMIGGFIGTPFADISGQSLMKYSFASELKEIKEAGK